jgi:anti-sigma regulatory factor (Ser/Thr protein kinase)
MDTSVPLEQLSDTILHRLAVTEPSDDVAFLAVRLVGSMSDPVRILIDARPAELARVRAALRAWLSDQEIPATIAYDVMVATGEACSNAVEHAYGAEAGTVEVTLFRSDTAVNVSVKDAGRWRGPRGKGRGRGLPMMQKLASSVDVSATDAGTNVQLEWRLPEAS